MKQLNAWYLDLFRIIEVFMIPGIFSSPLFFGDWRDIEVKHFGIESLCSNVGFFLQRQVADSRIQPMKHFEGPMW